jgi:hypothetical protein
MTRGYITLSDSCSSNDWADRKGLGDWIVKLISPVIDAATPRRENGVCGEARDSLNKLIPCVEPKKAAAGEAGSRH